MAPPFEIRKNPRTLDQSFYVVSTSKFKIDEGEVRCFLFEFASKVADIEKIDLHDPERNDFLDFIMRNYFHTLSDNAVYYSDCLSKSGQFRMGEDVNCQHPDMKKAIKLYFNNPINRNNYSIFQKAKSKGEFMPLSQRVTAS